MKIFDFIKRALGGKLSRMRGENQGNLLWGLFPLFGTDFDEFSGIVYACINLRANVIANANFRIYKVLESDEYAEVSKNHPAYKFLRKLNPRLTNYQFIYTTVAHLDLTGNAYWYIVRNALGEPVEAWLLNPGRVRIVEKNAVEIKHYEVYMEDGYIQLKPDEVVHFYYPDPNAIFYGKGPLQAIKFSADADSYMRLYWKKFFENAGVPPRLIFEAEKDVSLKTIEKFREDLTALGSNIEDFARPLVLPGGVKLRFVSLSPNELDWLKSRSVTIEDIIMAFGTPKTKLGLETGVNKAIAEASDYTFKADVIEPILNLIDQTVSDQILRRYFPNEDLIVRHDSVVPKDRQLVLDEYVRGLTYGWLTHNEVRKMEGFAPFDGGNVHYFPVNTAPVGVSNDNEQKGVIEPGIIEQYRKFSELDIEWRKLSVFAKKLENQMELKMRKVFREQMYSLLEQVVSLAKRNYIEGLVYIDLNEWIEKMRDVLDDELVEMLKQAIMHWASRYDVKPEFSTDDPRVAELINWLNLQIKDINETTVKQLTDLLSDKLKNFDFSETAIQSLASDIRQYFETVSFQRARRIAVTTATMAINATAQMIGEDYGLENKVWLSQRDNKVRESHKILDGQEVPIEGVFQVTSRKGVVSLRFPGDPAAPAEEAVNCRCYIILKAR